MFIKIEADLDNSTFQVEDERDTTVLDTISVEQMLDRIMSDVHAGNLSGKCRDSNGNTVGKWEISE